MKIKRKPAFFMAIALIIGILSSYLLISFSVIFIIKILMIIEFLSFIIYLFYKLENRKKSIYIGLMIFFVLLGSFLYFYEEYKYSSRYSIINFKKYNKACLLGKISFDIGDLESNKVYLKVDYINGNKVKYGKIIFNSEKMNKFNDGDLISLDANISIPNQNLNPGGFSYFEYLKKDGVYLQGWAPKNIKRFKINNSIKNLIIKLKKSLLYNINHFFNKDKAAFIKAILLGEKEYLDYQQQTLLQQAGASHLLAISGLHIGIIILCFSFVLFKIYSKKKNALYLLSILTVLYVVIVGASVSIIRAALLSLLFLWSEQFKREGDFLNIISVTLLINLIYKPTALFTVSLQLSYILVLGLFYLTPFLNNYLPVIFAVSAAAQLASLPIIAYYFHEYAWISLITNIWVIPYISFLLPIIFAFIFLSFFPLNIFNFFAWMINLGLDFLFKGLKLMTLIQGEELVIAEPNLLFIFLYYLFLFSLPFLFYKKYIYLKIKKTLFWQKTVPIFLLIIIFIFFIKPVPQNLVVNFVAVGQGDGIFIQFPGGQTMLIDTGPPGNDGRNIEYNIISYLNYLGIKNIDYLVISHFDADHAGCISHLLQRKKVSHILIPPFIKKTKLHQYLFTDKKNNFKVNYLTAGMSFEIANCIINVLNPKIDNLSSDRNENSIVLLISYKNKRFLFTGDLSKKGEERIVKDYNLQNIDILKAGHHGSKTSSGELFLNLVKPKLVVISVGKNNFGHPAPEVIKRFKQKSIKYLRTDQNGLIKIITDGENIYFNTFK